MAKVVVIGAGPAGLAAAAALSAARVSCVVLERADAVGASWRARYDGLRLNTNRTLSRLPGLRFPRGTPRFPGRDEVVAYLEAYAAHHRLDVRTGVEARRVERAGERWRVSCRDEDFEAEGVVVATGWDRVPHVPAWPGRDDFAGDLLHAAAYRSPEPYVGRSVLVVGPGCSGAEIAFQLAQAGAARAWLAVRTPPHVVLRSWGIPSDVVALLAQRQPLRVADTLARAGRRLAVGDLSSHGLPAPDDGLFERFERRQLAPTTIDREVVEAIRDRRVEVVSAVTAFDERSVALADGTRLRPDAVIAATGYRRGLEDLVGHLGVLDSDGAPRVAGGREDPAAPGLRFVGFDPRLAGTFRQIRLEARRLGREAREATLAAPG
jgi:cation diffusion facilitator CzcD-associated flavoprotein CzcO